MASATAVAIWSLVLSETVGAGTGSGAAGDACVVAAKVPAESGDEVGSAAGVEEEAGFSATGSLDVAKSFDVSLEGLSGGPCVAEEGRFVELIVGSGLSDGKAGESKFVGSAVTGSLSSGAGVAGVVVAGVSGTGVAVSSAIIPSFQLRVHFQECFP